MSRVSSVWVKHDVEPSVSRLHLRRGYLHHMMATPGRVYREEVRDSLQLYGTQPERRCVGWRWRRSAKLKKLRN